MAFKRSLTLLAFLAASVVASPHGGQDSGSDGSRCAKNDFWYTKKEVCLPYGGGKTSHSPPAGKSCPPTNWYWHLEKSCCVPSYPPPSNPPPPQCKGGHEWNQETQCCEPGNPTSTNPPPSHPSNTPKNPYGSEPHDSNPPKKGGYKKRSQPVTTGAFCPRNYTACPINSLRGGDYECVDTTVELRSCGGCSSIGQGQDCTTIPGAWNVGCEAGVCAVYTCALGYKVSSNGVSCELL